MIRPSLAPAAAGRAVAGAYACVLFGADPRLGALLLALTLLRPASGLGGLVAAGAGTLTAHLLGYRPDAIRAGVYGYNALLVGLAVMAGRGLDAGTLALVALAGAAAALLTAVLGDALRRGFDLPVLALPFALLGALLRPALDAQGVVAGAAWIDDRAWTLLPPLPAPVDAVLRGFGALFFQPGPEAGLVALGVALAVSRIGAVAMLAGMAAAGLMVRLLGATSDPATLLAAQYNGALTGAAVGAFLFVPGRAAALAGLGAAALAGWLSVALAALFGRIGLPLLAWPFVLVTLVVVRALALRAPDRPPFPAILPGLSPEANFDCAMVQGERLGVPGPPRLALPVEGTWAITQGIDGAHTHRDAWAHAWDFEVVDANGFPFRGDGTRREDYFCFDRAVLAPGAGVVAAVHDGAADGAPGELDPARPWGNAVVIGHGPDLFTVVAHLACGSILVRLGQPVAAGAPVARCGSSGRSPRPHLHLQAQRTPELGAPAIPCRIVDYLVERPDGRRRWIPLGVPAEGERVARPEVDPVRAAVAALPPGMVLEFDGAAPARLVSEVTLLGERCLHDPDRGERLYFVPAPGGPAFTVLAGRPGGPLWALFLALPRLPVAAGDLEFEDRPPARLLLSRAGSFAHDLVRALADPLAARSETNVRAAGGVTVVETLSTVRLHARTIRRLRARAELDGDGIRTLEVEDHPGADALRFAAHRPAHARAAAAWATAR